MIAFTFADNQEPQENGRWFDQVRKRFEIEEENFTKTKTPGDTIAIDESMVPWRDRLLFRQNNPGQAQKYGVKNLQIKRSRALHEQCLYWKNALANEPRPPPIAHKLY